MVNVMYTYVIVDIIFVPIQVIVSILPRVILGTAIIGVELQPHSRIHHNKRRRRIEVSAWYNNNSMDGIRINE